MTFARVHKVVVYLAAGLGLAALALGTGLGTGAEIAILVAYAGSWFAEGRILDDPRWARGWTIGLFSMLAAQVGRGLLGEAPLELALEFVAALSISRLYNRRTAAEHLQIAGLAILQLTAATVLSSDLGYAFLFLAFVVVLPWALALAHLRAEIERPLVEGDGPADPARLRRALAARSVVGSGFFFGIAGLSVPLFLGTGLLFVLFPRVGMGYLSFDQSAGQRVSGFGSDVELGDFGVIRTDPTVVLRVTPPDLSEPPAPTRSIRMRGTSFDHYDGRRWTRTRELRAALAVRYDDTYAVPHRLPYAADPRWEVDLDQLDESVVFFPPDAVALEIPPRVENGADVGREVYVAPGLDVRYEDADGLGLRYTVFTSDRRPAPEALRPGLARRYLQVPEGHERVGALAATWTQGATDDYARARAIEARLRDSGEFVYSLETPRVGDRRPLDVFLFDAKRGHCEYFATAAAVMLRTQGIPARNVTGFLGGRWNDFGDYYALSQGDAHSWVEAWVEGRGWVMLDPTPPARGEIAPEVGWAAPLREAYDALARRWASDIVAFDLRDQVRGLRRAWRLYRDVRGAFGDEDEREVEAAADGDERSPRRWPWAVGVAVAVFLALWWWRRRVRGEPALPPSSRAAVALYRALERELARRGHARPADRAPGEHAAALEAAGYAGAETVREVTDAYLATRWGAAPLPDADRARLESAIRALP